MPRDRGFVSGKYVKQVLGVRKKLGKYTCLLPNIMGVPEIQKVVNILQFTP